MEEKIKNEDGHRISKFQYIIHKISAYLIAARMPAILVVISFFLLGEWYSVGIIPLYFSVLVILYLICFQFVHGLTNMVFDKKLDIFSGKSIMYVFKYISSKEMLFSSLILSVIGLLFLWYVNQLVFIIGLILLLITIAYATPPLRLKIRPPFDSIANALQFATLPFFLGWTVTGNSLNLLSIIFGITMGLPAITCYFIVSWQDINTDKNFGINTSCTRLGHDATIDASIIIWFFHLVIAIIFFGLFSLITIVAIVCFPVILAIKIVYKKTTDYKDRVISLQFLSTVSETIWLDFILLPLAIWTVSLIPIILFIIVLLISNFLYIKYYIKCGKKIINIFKK